MPAGPPRWQLESSGGFAAVDERIALIRALGALPPRQRAALVLRYFDDLSEAEVASTLGCSVGTVKSTTSRALEKMRALDPEREVAAAAGSEVLACPERWGARR